MEIAQRCLLMNQRLFGPNHLNNADIIYVIVKAYTALKDYKNSIIYLEKMIELYKLAFGPNCEKIAKVKMEIGQIYSNDNSLNDAISSYESAKDIYEKVINDNNYDIIFTLSIIISELYTKIKSFDNAYKILVNIDDKYSSFSERSEKDKIEYQLKRVNTCCSLKNKNKDLLLEEYIRLEVYINFI